MSIQEWPKLSNIDLTSIPDPDIQEIPRRDVVERRESGRTWHYEEHKIKEGTFYKIGADTIIVCSNLRKPVEFLLNNTTGNRYTDIVILSKTHGTPTGYNYIAERWPDDQRDIVRYRRLLDGDFFDEDVDAYQKGRIIVRDISRISTESLEHYITGPFHLILGFCYSRNDYALRHCLKLKSVISYKPIN